MNFGFTLLTLNFKFEIATLIRQAALAIFYFCLELSICLCKNFLTMNYDISNLSNVVFVRSPRARHLRITLHPDKTVRVTIPRLGSKIEAEKFLQSKSHWLKKHLQKIDKYNQLQELPAADIDIKKAQEDLFDRLDRFAEKYNLSYRKVSFRRQRTKWGSCSGKNNISLNVNMVFLPAELQDYILLHELCHIPHKNHSQRFWGQLDQYVQGKAKMLSKQLKKYRMPRR